MNVNFAPEILIKDQLDLRIRSTETGGLRSSLRAKKATEFAALWVEAWNSSRSQCWRTQYLHVRGKGARHLHCVRIRRELEGNCPSKIEA
jgi:hypothetical protein